MNCDSSFLKHFFNPHITFKQNHAIFAKEQKQELYVISFFKTFHRKNSSA